MNTKTSILATGVLMATLIATSPAALADNHGKNKQGGNRDRQEMCEDYRKGEGRFDRESRRQEMQQNRIEMADRLKLNQDQRKILKQIHLERQQEMDQRMDKWEQKMEKRCSEKGNKDKRSRNGKKDNNGM